MGSKNHPRILPYPASFFSNPYVVVIVGGVDDNSLSDQRPT